MDAPTDRGSAAGTPTFEPLRPASSGRRAAILIAGPLLWVAALIAVAFALKYGEVVEIALGVVLVSFLAALAVLIPGRGRRIREEEAS